MSSVNADLADGAHRFEALAASAASLSRKLSFPGWERLLRAAFPPESFRGVRQFELDVAYDEGLRVRCNPSSYIEWSIFFLGQYGAPTAQIVRSLLDEGDFAVDVGANIGAYTLIMSRMVGSTGRVAAFEPNPEVYVRLVENLRVNNFCNRTELHVTALSADIGSEMLHLPPSGSWNRGTATLLQLSRPQGDAIKVQVETLDRVIHNWRRCDLIKIDTDGNDFAVLQGATQIIRRFLPNLIFEFDPGLWPNAGADGHRLRTELALLGYRFYWVDQRWRRLKKLGSDSFLKGNILALSPNRQLRKI